MVGRIWNTSAWLPVYVEEGTIGDQTVGLGHAELLAGVDLFRELNRVALAQLAAHLETVPFEAGTAVFAQGDVGDSLYIVSRGRFAVIAGADELGETRLGTLGPGDVFGELALLTGEPRSATIRADTDGELLRLARPYFQDLLVRTSSLASAVAIAVAQRLVQADRRRTQGRDLTARMLAHELSRLSSDRRDRVLQSSVLERVSPSATRAVFGAAADSVLADLADIGVSGGESALLLRHILRELFDQQVGPARAHQFGVQAAERLAAEGEWREALALSSRLGDRRLFASVFGRALRAAPPLAPEEILHWAGQLSDEDAAQDPDLALARAAVHHQQGNVSGAAEVLRRALGSALTKNDAEGGARLAAESARLAGGASQASRGLGARKQLASVLPHPAVLPTTAILLAVALVVAAAITANAGHAWVFGLLLAATVVLRMGQVAPNFAVSLGLVAAWVLFGISSLSEALGGFASTDWVFVLAVLGLAAAAARSGLVFRVGLLFIRRLPRGLFRQAGTLLLTGALLGPLLPHSSGRAALTAPLAVAVAETLRLRDREPGAAVLGLSAWIGSSPLMFVFLNASPLCLLGWGLLPQASRARFDWAFWLAAALPLGLFAGLGGLLGLFLVLRPGTAINAPRERVAFQLALLGPLSTAEKAMLLVLALTLAGWTFAPAIGLDVTTVAVLGLVGAVATGNFGQWTLRELDWDYLLFYGVALSISRVAASLDVQTALVNALGLQPRPGPTFQIELSALAFVLVIACLSLAIRLAVPQEQAVLLLCLALIPLAPSVGVDPGVVVLTVLATSALWFLPAQTPSYLVAYAATDGRLFTHVQAKLAAFAYAAVIVVGLALSVPYWHLLGLL